MTGAPTRNSATLVALALAAALLTIAASVSGIFWLEVIFKPLALLLLIAFAVENALASRLAVSRWISMGLAFSLWGDIFLLWPERFFHIGLLAFLMAHVSYLMAFARDAKFPAKVSVWLAFLAVAAANFFQLMPSLPGRLAIPVAVYSLALSTMAAQAIGRYLLLRTAAAKLAAIGAVFFVASDTLLAWDRFHARLPLAALLILVPYYTAQFLIALSTRASAAAAP